MRLIFEADARIAQPASSRVIPLASRSRRSCRPSSIRRTVGVPDRSPSCRALIMLSWRYSACRGQLRNHMQACHDGLTHRCCEPRRTKSPSQLHTDRESPASTHGISINSWFAGYPTELIYLRGIQVARLRPPAGTGNYPGIEQLEAVEEAGDVVFA